MEYKIIIQGRLPGLNEYINACRSNRYVGAKMKDKTEELIGYYLLKLSNLKLQRFTVNFAWYEKDRNRDPDNIAFAKKFIFDAMQKKDVITGDGWANVVGFADDFYVDKANPRIEVLLTTVEEVKSRVVKYSLTTDREEDNGQSKVQRKRVQRPNSVRGNKTNIDRAVRTGKTVQ